jgi:DNA-binding NarL/FixJ family response regulator
LTRLARLLVADYGLVRLGVRLAVHGEAEICAEADDAEGAILEACRAQPDLCLVGWDLPGGALTAVRGILKELPSTAVIVVADSRDVDDLLAAVRAGAVGYVPGDVNSAQLRRVVRAVLAQEASVPRSMVRALLHELYTAARLGAQGVTAREAEVLGMLRRGHSTAQIARRLEISPVTVRRHISELVRKLGVDDRRELLLDGRALTLVGDGQRERRGAPGGQATPLRTA